MSDFSLTLNGKPPLPPIITPPPVPIFTTPPPPQNVLPLGARVYVSTQGDAWDMIAMRVYGLKRGNEHLMYRLLEHNYPLRDISIFSAGIAVLVPDIQNETEIPLVPWKVTTVVP
jgi:phage tail protein X